MSAQREVSATCPGVEVVRDFMLISHDEEQWVRVDAYDAEAFAEAVIAARDELRAAGFKTAWSRDADGEGNCGAVYA